MSKLERRCRLLLRAYPAGYRQGRGEEIIGTLLEATPEGRSWPLARDIRGLLTGGLRARAVANRRQTTASNLRIAVLVGVSAFLAFATVNFLAFAVVTVTEPVPAVHIDAPQLLAATLTGLAVVVAWASRRRAVVVAVVLAAAVAVSLRGPWPLISEVTCLAALGLTASRGEQPGRRWLWPVALVAALPLLSYMLPTVSVTVYLVLAVTVGAISLLWALIDARPAVAAAVFLLAYWLPVGITSLLAGAYQAVVPPLIVTVLSAVAVWQLHRQSVRVTAPDKTP